MVSFLSLAKLGTLPMISKPSNSETRTTAFAADLKSDFFPFGISPPNWVKRKIWLGSLQQPNFPENLKGLQGFIPTDSFPDNEKHAMTRRFQTQPDLDLECIVAKRADFHW